MRQRAIFTWQGYHSRNTAAGSTEKLVSFKVRRMLYWTLRTVCEFFITKLIPHVNKNQHFSALLRYFLKYLKNALVQVNRLLCILRRFTPKSLDYT